MKKAVALENGKGGPVGRGKGEIKFCIRPCREMFFTWIGWRWRR